VYLLNEAPTPHDELAPIKDSYNGGRTAIFNTDFMDSRSLSKIAQQVDDYAATVGTNQRNRGRAQSSAARRYFQPAQAIVRLAKAAEPLVHLPPGTNAVERIAEKDAFVEGETAKWRNLAEFAGFWKAASRRLKFWRSRESRLTTSSHLLIRLGHWALHGKTGSN
jgi:hypothetical protein